jgi:hypothetical protein
MTIGERYKVKSIPNNIIKEWLLKKHYLKRIPSISYAFGLFENDIMIGIVTFGNAIPMQMKKSICGEKHMSLVYELNRLVINEPHEKNIGSYFLSQSFKLLPKPMIIVSYADTEQSHNGYIYQASNFIYTGLSHVQKDWKIAGKEDMHSRTLMDEFPFQKDRINKLKEKYGDDLIQVERKPKHRYLYFIGNKRQIKTFWYDSLFEKKPYPKGENKRYDASYNPTIQTQLF